MSTQTPNNSFHSDGGALTIFLRFEHFSKVSSFQIVQCSKCPPRVKLSVSAPSEAWCFL
jgi:hypothetical protein